MAPKAFYQVKIVVSDFDYNIVFAHKKMRPGIRKFAAGFGGVQLVKADVEDVGIAKFDQARSEVVLCKKIAAREMGDTDRCNRNVSATNGQLASRHFDGQATDRTLLFCIESNRLCDVVRRPHSPITQDARRKLTFG